MRCLPAALLALFLCLPSGHAAAAPQVAVSIKPVHALVTALMDGVGTPALLFDGVEALAPVLAPARAERLRDADLVIWVGPELEKSLVPLLRAVETTTRVLTILDGDQMKILPARAAPDSRDPFLWLDIRSIEVLIDALLDELVALDPAHAAQYRDNRHGLKYRIARLDREFEFGFRAVAAGVSWVYHDTQQYFEQAYAFKVRGQLAPVPGGDADMATLLTARSQLAGAGKTCFFTEKGLSTANLPLLASGASLAVYELDSLGSGIAAGAGAYEQIMRHNYSRISACFKAIGAPH